MELLNEEELTPMDVVRLDDQGEKCVKAVKKIKRIYK